jgi:hypothetical protein
LARGTSEDRGREAPEFNQVVVMDCTTAAAGLGIGS